MSRATTALRLVARTLLLWLLTGLGLAAGVFGAFFHGWLVPLGLLVSLVGLAAVLALAMAATSSRSGPALAAVGWFLAVLVLSAARPEGDVVVDGTATGYGYLLLGSVLATGSLVVSTLYAVGLVGGPDLRA